MSLPRESIRQRAVKEGVKASKKRHHLVTEEELLSLKVQLVPILPRIALGVSGALLITLCCLSWPATGTSVRSLEAISGTLLFLFSLFGIRRTLEQLLDACDAVNLVGSIIESIADAVSNIDL